jgi:hypothetical protein
MKRRVDADQPPAVNLRELPRQRQILFHARPFVVTSLPASSRAAGGSDDSTALSNPAGRTLPAIR